MDVSRLEITTDAKGKRVINKKYRIVRKIGEGQYGKVLLGEKVNDAVPASPLAGRSSTRASGDHTASSHASETVNDGEFVAIKTINRIDKTKLITKTYLNHTTKIKREIQIMKECNHPNVVKLYQVIDDLKYDKILLILEYCDTGEIDWKNYNHYNEKEKEKNRRAGSGSIRGLTINKILRDVINGLEYLHEYKGIIHRDLKPSNLLIKNGQIKISDFGVSLILENNSNDDKELGKTMGTPAFFAPELCQFVNNRLSMLDDIQKQNKNKIDKRIDLWSLGVILYCLIFHELPFNGKNEFGLFKNIVTKPLKFPKINFKSRFSELDKKEFDLLRDLIEHLLIKDPNERFTIEDVKNHNFTTFDLTLTESLSFKKFNDNVINDQMGFANRIKKFFGGKVVESVNPVKPEKLPTGYQEQLNNLEPVDDLLDSYFDSSSLGSIESDFDEDHDEGNDPSYQVQETNIFEATHKVESSNKKSQRRSSRQSQESKPSDDKLTQSKLNHRVKVPPPLDLHKLSLGSPVESGFTTPLKPVATPVSATLSISSASSMFSNHIVSIGPNSPVYSPTRNFFEKINQVTPTHTISSLSSPPKPNKDVNDKLDLAPPTIFKSRTVSSPKDSSHSRKNSISSVHSNGSRRPSLGNLTAPLTRITSSSSSLNLNAYLTDDNFSINRLSTSTLESTSSVDPREQGSDSESDTENDTTFVLPEAEESTALNGFHYRDMSDYLSKLEQID